MKRVYKTQNVYDATQERLDFMFSRFERIYLSFSGGKDSGVMLNLVADYMRKHKISEKIGIMILDNEANFTQSLEFMHTIIRANLDIFDVYWCCLPITLPCTVSHYEIDWQCWGEEDQERWVRPMLTDDYIIHMGNNPFPFFRPKMSYQEFWDEFGEWYSQGKLTACMIGIRAAESLNRFRAILNENKEMLEGRQWTKRNMKNVFNVYPIYDWKTDDIWTANAKFGWEYNTLYDLFYMAGVPIGKMRVASPFMSESKSSLNMYRVIDPQTWARLCSRVHGANFVATYGKQLNYKSVKLPPGHTWKSFVKFLLATLPEDTSANFKARFIQSFLYWGRVGRGLPAEIIRGLKEAGIRFKENGFTRHGSKTLTRVRIQSYPDHVDMLKCHHSIVASWKRFAITILKNDHQCKYMGLSQTKEQIVRQRMIMKKYSKI
jgi:predicted phosphoadenosine phosphosulfate sulfurtransferase